MDNKTVFDAVSGIDREFISEYDNSVKKIREKNAFKKKAAVTAACFAAVIAVVTGVVISGVNGKPPAGTGNVSENAAGNTNGDFEVSGAVSLTGKKEIITAASTEDNADKSESLNPSEKKNQSQKNDTQNKTATVEKQDGSVTVPQKDSKGGDTSEFLQNYAIGSDGSYYKIFRPGVDVFEPEDRMSLENRFCSVQYNGYSYYPAPDGDLTDGDYDSEVLKSVKAQHCEIRSVNDSDEVSGIEYVARVDVHRLNGYEPEEAIACVISFNGETKAYKYFVSP